MVETSETSVGDVTGDPNFAFMIIGALTWLLGLYIPFIGPLFTSAGFIITVLAVASSAPGRNPDDALLGILIGGLLIILSGYIPFIGSVFFISGVFLVLFFGIPFALKHSRVPLHEVFQDEWAKRSQASKKKETKQDSADDEGLDSVGGLGGL